MSQHTGFYVYLHRRNDTNEVFYIGKGCRGRSTSKHGRSEWWHRIVEKAGGFTVEFVEKGLTNFSAVTLEIELIKFYRDNGHTLCNITSGGEGATGRICSEETRKKIGEANKGTKACVGREMSEETRQKISKANKGRTRSDEQKQKLSDYQRGRKKSKEHVEAVVQSQRKPVRCSNGMVFASARHAAEWLLTLGFEKATRGPISQCCRGKLKRCYGFTWEYIINETA